MPANFKDPLGLKSLSINIIGLSLKVHHFTFSLGDAFLQEYGKGYIPGGQFSVEVVLDKHETFIEADFKIEGSARLTCDRSLEPFDFPITLTKKMLFKYGEEEDELSDEIMIISRDRVSLEIGQLIYEYIALAIPMKKLHPKFQDEAEEEDELEGKVIYSSSTEADESASEEDIDPIWEKLKKLK